MNGIQTFPRLSKKLLGYALQRNGWIRMLSNEINANNLVTKRTTSPKEKPAENDLVFGKSMSDHMLVINWSLENGWEAPEVLPYGPLSITPSASVLHYGLEVFEGMKAYRGFDGEIRLFRPMENMQRFLNSATRLSLPAFDKAELLKCITELVKVDQDWIPNSQKCSLYIRPTMISTESTLGVKPPARASLFVITGPVGPYFTTGTFSPVSLLADPRFVRAWPGGIGECKAGGNYGPTIYAQQIAQEKGCSQCLWLYNNEVTEVGTMNLFMYWINENGEEELITPPLNGLILPGVTRKSILELAREWNQFKVTEKTFTIQDLKKAVSENRVKEIFGAGTACVVCPVDKILFEDEFINIPTMENGPDVAKKFYQELTEIQYGVKQHEWSSTISDHKKAEKIKSMV